MNAFDPIGVYLAVQTLGWTLLHFLWQGAFLGLVYYLLMGAFSRATPILRYRLGLGMFCLMALCPVLTFMYLFDPAAAATAARPLPGMMVAATGGGGGVPVWLVWEQALEPYLPWAVAAWFAGVMLMSARVSWDWWQVRRLVRIQVRPLPSHWDRRVAELAAALRVTRPVRALCSGVVRVPAVVGWLRPVILLPAAALTALDRRQLELIVAHELAHIRRADYLVNLFQVMVETLLFYHPVVRWVSNRLRAERELCCDDEVVASCGDALTYAKALAELESQRQVGFQTALAASGGSLSRRIHRMLEHPMPRRGVMIWGTSLMLALAAGSMAIAAQLALRPPAPPVPVATPAPSEATADVAARAGGRPPALAGSGLSERFPSLAGRGLRGGSNLQTANVLSPSPQPSPSREREDRASTSGRTGSTPAPNSEQSVPRPPPQSAVSAPMPAEKLETPTREPSPQPMTEEIPVAARSMTSSVSKEAASAAMPKPDKNQTPLTLARATRAESLAEQPPMVSGGDPINLVAPEYPRRARMRGLEGLVVAEFTIDADGRVGAIEIVRSRPAGVFSHAVTQALAQWRFEPLLQDGRAVDRRVSKAFEFTLNAGVTSGDGNGCDPVTGTRICRFAPIAEG